MTDLLHLRAEGPDDLPILSALVQDMVVRVAEIGFDSRARRLILLGNRFRHEARRPSRARALLRVDFVSALRRRNWPAAKETVLPLLAVVYEEGALLFRFGNGADLKVEVETLDISLDDVAGPWGTRKRPRHT